MVIFGPPRSSPPPLRPPQVSAGGYLPTATHRQTTSSPPTQDFRVAVNAPSVHPIAREKPPKMATTTASLAGDRNLSKSVTRLLQHSILQLCNEHIGYSHKLQILGVLCMTVDDEQQELVVKVNNTLKRVNPVPASTVPVACDPTQVTMPSAVTPMAFSTADSIANYSNIAPREELRSCSPGQSYMGANYSIASIAADTPALASALTSTPLPANQSLSPTPPSSHTPTPAHTPLNGSNLSMRKGHGRKGANPVKVHHVIDEGELISSDEDQDVLTVIPTDPESSMTFSPITATPERAATSPRPHSQHKPSVPVGSAKRKGHYKRIAQQLQKANKTHEPSRDGSPMVSPQNSTVRALLTGAAVYSGGELTPVGGDTGPAEVQDLSMRNVSQKQKQQQQQQQQQQPMDTEITEQPRHPAFGLALPILVAQQINIPSLDDPTDHASQLRAMLNYAASAPDSATHNFAMRVAAENGLSSRERDVDEMALRLVEERSNSGRGSVGSSPVPRINGDGSVLADYDTNLVIKEESDGHSPSPSSSYAHSAEDLSQMVNNNGMSLTNGSIADAHPTLQIRLADGLPSQVPYSSLAFSTPTASPSKKHDGLSIRYTNTGPITVSPNGKNMSQPPNRIKDIIVYDETSPLHMQKGNRIEADYMVDALGFEGRKRRRRAPDDSLTPEEIAEYLGSAESQEGNFKCQYCNETVPELTRYLQHTLTAHSAYICHQCGKSFTTKSSLLRHRPIHTGMRRFACSICKKTFYRKDKCKAHIKRHLGTVENEAAEVETYGMDPLDM